ncbi:hypothetical protein, partial [Sutterella wadsworthensis]|uniref:hypothetical protein n=1 Tax=Sutterella wadsworthensis TaxID=40545 RepID=UPI00241CB10B
PSAELSRQSYDPAESRLNYRDHNATSYSTETRYINLNFIILIKAFALYLSLKTSISQATETNCLLN